MLISTRGRYALRVMVDLAEQGQESPVPLKAIAARQEISEKYLESIIKSLVAAGLLAGQRGKAGGYRLTASPAEISVGSVLRLTEGTLAPVACLAGDAQACEREAACRTLPLWRELDRRLNSFLDGVTLAELMRGAQAQAEGGPAGEEKP